MAHPNSGAGSIKHDGHDGECLYEIKDANKSYTLKGKELIELFRRATQQGKYGVMIIYFTQCDFTAEVRIVPGGKRLCEM